MTIKAKEIIEGLLFDTEVYVGPSITGEPGPDLSDIDDDDIRVDGYVVDTNQSKKRSIQPLQSLFGFDLIESNGNFKAVRRGGSVVAVIEEGAPNGFLQDRSGDTFEEDREQEADVPVEVHIEFFRGPSAARTREEADYRKTTVQERRITRSFDTGAPAFIPNDRNETIRVPAACTTSTAQAAAFQILTEADIGRTRYKIRLPRDYLYLEQSDPVELVFKDRFRVRGRIARIDVGRDLSLRVDVVREDFGQYDIYEPSPAGSQQLLQRIDTGDAGTGRPNVVQIIGGRIRIFLLDIPILADDGLLGPSGDSNRVTGYWALSKVQDPEDPVASLTWTSDDRSAVLLRRSQDDATATRLGSVPAGLPYGTIIGTMPDPDSLWAFNPNQRILVNMGFIDPGAVANVRYEDLVGGMVDGFDSDNNPIKIAVQGGKNAAAIIRSDGQVEIIQYQNIRYSEPFDRWEISGLLRGRRGTDYAAYGHAAGEEIILLGDIGDDVSALRQISRQEFRSVELNRPGGNDVKYQYSAPTGMQRFEDALESQEGFAYTGRAVFPYAPVPRRIVRSSDGDITIRWFRRSYTRPAESQTIDGWIKNGIPLARFEGNAQTGIQDYNVTILAADGITAAHEFRGTTSRITQSDTDPARDRYEKLVLPLAQQTGALQFLRDASEITYRINQVSTLVGNGFTRTWTETIHDS